MSKLIIVCGLSGAGKTSLAKALSQKLNIACLHKDIIKETLYEALNFSTLEESKKIGIHSVKLLFEIAENIISNKVDIIIESPFNFSGDYQLFQKWIDEYNIELYSIICSVPNEERLKRIKSRPRHQAHHDIERNHENSTGAEESVYDALPGKQIKIVTNQPVEQLVSEIIKLL